MNRTQKLRRWLQENGWNLALSFAFTVLIMYLIDDELQDTWSDVAVRIELDAPQEYILSVAKGAQLKRHVTLRGPREKLTEYKATVSANDNTIVIEHTLSRDDLELQLSNSRRQPNNPNLLHSTSVVRGQLGHLLPVGITIAAGADFPWRVEYSLDKTETVERALEVTWRERPREGFRVSRLATLPAKVRIEGPQNTLKEFRGPVLVEVSAPRSAETFRLEGQQANAENSNLPANVRCQTNFDVVIEIVPDDVWWTELPVHPADTTALSPGVSTRQMLEVPMQVRAPIGLPYQVLPHKDESPIYLNVRAPLEVLEPLSRRALLAKIRAYFILDTDDLTPTLRGQENDRLTEEKQESLIYLELPPSVSEIQVAVHPDGLFDQWKRNRDGSSYELLRERYRYEIKEP